MNKFLKDTITLINDANVNKVSLYAGDAAKYTDQAIREAFFTILGDDKLTHAGWRNHKNEIFTIMEEVLNTNLPLVLQGANSPFYREFVDVRNLALGDKNEFIVEDDSTVVACNFSGNHWATDRKKLPGKKSFTLDTEWIYVHLYDDLERFLKGIVTLPEMLAKMQQALTRAIDDRIAGAFAGASTYLPAEFIENGVYDKKTMSQLIERVEIASGTNVVLAGTRTALSAIQAGESAAWVSEDAKKELATTGMVLDLTGLGVKAVQIPQSFIRGTYQFKVPNDEIFVLPNNDKFIKVVYEGDTRARELGYTDTIDQTVSAQVQTKVGVACVFNTLYGKYTVK